jgi:general secretion pathway protein G
MSCNPGSLLVARPPSGVRNRLKDAQPRAAVLQKSRRRAFSLVEISVVILIMGLMASIVTINVRGYLIKAKQNAARLEITNIIPALDTFYAAYNRYPTNEEGLAVLTQPSEKLPEKLLTALPVDPWGRPYQYNSPGRNGPYEIICWGADGREGGDGADTDISSDKLKE